MACYLLYPNDMAYYPRYKIIADDAFFHVFAGGDMSEGSNLIVMDITKNETAVRISTRNGIDSGTHIAY